MSGLKREMSEGISMSGLKRERSEDISMSEEREVTGSNGASENMGINGVFSDTGNNGVPGNGMNMGSVATGINNVPMGGGIVTPIVEGMDQGKGDESSIYQNNKPPIMDQFGQDRDKEYQDLVKEVTPTHSLISQMFHAFWTGGLVCVLGQFIINTALQMGADDKTAGSWCSLILILISVLLTGFNLFGVIAKYAGAGILVPITGFANGIASSAIEFQKEGQVFGIGCKIFTIAGPVILYGLMSSWILGVLYWIGTMTGARM